VYDIKNVKTMCPPTNTPQKTGMLRSAVKITITNAHEDLAT
jgi:hypothetical protein